MTRIAVYDTTLRDGMQGHGMSLSVEEKVRVAHALDDLAIPFIEAGFPASNPKETELFERLEHEGLRAAVCAFGMTRRRGVPAEEDGALREVDDRPVGTGEPGEITRTVQSEFEDALHGRSERYADWLDVVAAPAPAT